MQPLWFRYGGTSTPAIGWMCHSSELEPHMHDDSCRTLKNILKIMHSRLVAVGDAMVRNFTHETANC